MTSTVTILRVIGILGVVSAVLAAATLWVVFTQPITVAAIAYDGDLSRLLDLLTAALTSVVRTAVAYL